MYIKASTKTSKLKDYIYCSTPPVTHTFHLLADNFQGSGAVVHVVTNHNSAFISAISEESLSRLVRFNCLG